MKKLYLIFFNIKMNIYKISIVTLTYLIIDVVFEENLNTFQLTLEWGELENTETHGAMN